MPAERTLTSRPKTSNPGDLICIVGDTGTGKTTSCRNLPPENSFILGTIQKKLPFLGARKKFNVERGNLKYTLSINKAIALLRNPPETEEQLRHLVIDDAYFLMMQEFSEKFGQKLSKDGVFGMYRELALNQWGFYKVASQVPYPIKTFLMLHDEETITGKIITKSIGAMTENRLNPPSLFTYVLYADRIFVEDEVQHVFFTKTDGLTPAKCPVGLFPRIIPNDLWLVSQRLDEYAEGVPLEDSELDFGDFSLGRTQAQGIKKRRDDLLRETGRLRTPPKRGVKVKEE